MHRKRCKRIDQDIKDTKDRLRTFNDRNDIFEKNHWEFSRIRIFQKIIRLKIYTEFQTIYRVPISLSLFLYIYVTENNKVLNRADYLQNNNFTLMWTIHKQQ